MFPAVQLFVDPSLEVVFTAFYNVVRLVDGVVRTPQSLVYAKNFRGPRSSYQKGRSRL